MKTKSTHVGHCQCCGSKQKLPKGLLSLHGYTRKFHFFSGTCRGSNELPFEQSCDLIKTFIAYAQEKLESQLAFQAKLREKATEAKGWIHEYVSWQHSPLHKGGYVWREVEIKQVPWLSSDGETYYKYTCLGKDNKEHKIELYEMEISDILEAATKMNKAYAVYKQKDIEDIRKYIVWQENRVKTWQKADLMPIGV